MSSTPSLRRRNGVLALSAAALVTTFLLYLLFHDSPLYPLDKVDLTLRFPTLSSAFRSSSTLPWTRPILPDYCSPGSPEDFWSTRYTEENLSMARSYSGSGTRFRHLVEKAMRGEPVKMGVIGGSVSRGRNSGTLGPYHQRIFRFWNTTFFPHPENWLADGSRPATGSSYFSMCWGEHIPQDVELVFVELSINDYRTTEAASIWETLVRSLLELPTKPTVIAINSFALHGRNGIRNPTLPYLLANPALEASLFGSENGIDPKHINDVGHQMVADFTTHWMRDEICRVMSERDVPPGSVRKVEDNWWTEPIDLGAVPHLRMTEQWRKVNDTIPSLHPTCKSTSSRPPLQPSKGEEWYFEEAPGDKFYWSASKPGAKITFGLDIAEGRVGMFFLRSRKQWLGNVKCWLDDNVKASKLVEGWWNKDESVSDYVALWSNVASGKHNLTCEVQTTTKDPGGGHAFKIIGLATV
ncbi:hypothetical protein DACRYDRAFT_109587 [Dacryopinax primogenitus]|uniref:SGNH hydrolase n=1 Tax=Dacryopinax primogenitus (strain DJM 731) TaxID=1858805 RepID=M5G6U9_DACPD|nr:uncharacterized protein DACRYDRAFT_109587 [Dacryopinax primogenitus]EJT99482.1 hypothetical protein DACRYDRAFT_109587 [Dacryopinax primogenitus]